MSPLTWFPSLTGVDLAMCRQCDAVEVRLLGPFEIRVAEGPVLVGSPKCRTLLAALTVQPGRLVPTAELTEAIWGSGPPDNPRAALQVWVARTRRLLVAAGAPPLIATGVAGYRADIAADCVDVTRFQRLLEQARHAADRSDVDSEWAALTAALELWRGEAFADVPSDHLQREHMQHLAEQRLQALERRIDVSVRLGRHAEAVDELRRLTSRHPLRERLWAQLMTALNLAGRRSEALATYHRVSRHLADELGIEPAEDLQHLYARTLRGDGGSAAQPAALPAVPRELPPGIVGFVGRTAELARMQDILDRHDGSCASHSALLVVNGMAGVGKTALAQHWARRVADRFPDGQVWVELRGFDNRAPATPQEALRSLLRALRVRDVDMPADLDGLVGLYRSLTDGRRMLIVLDNASSAQQVRPLLPGGTESVVLVTSRSELAALIVTEGAYALRLEPFNLRQAQQMLIARLGRRRVDAEPEPVENIVDKCGGLPLALALVAARAVARPTFTLAMLAQEVAEASNRLDTLASVDAGIDVRDVFSWSYNALSPQAAHLFRLLGLNPTTNLSTFAATSLMGTSRRETRALLADLATANLVAERTPDRYVLHDLVHAYAVALADEWEEPHQRRASQRRLLNWMLGTALNARPLLQPSDSGVAPPDDTEAIRTLTFTSERQALEWSEAERPNLIACVRLAHALGLDDLCWRLAYASWTHLHLVGAWSELLDTHQIGLRSAVRSGDDIGRGQILTGMGVAYRSTGRYALACEAHQDALAIFRRAGYATGVSNALNNLGAAYRDAGRYDEALDCTKQANEMDRRDGHIGNLSISLYQTGLTLTAAGRSAEAVSVLAESLQLIRKIGHRRAEARILGAVAAAHIQLGRHPVAVEHQRAAIDIYRELGDRWYEAATLNLLGDTLRDVSLLHDSREAWTRALAIYEELGAANAAGLRAKLKR